MAAYINRIFYFYVWSIKMCCWWFFFCLLQNPHLPDFLEVNIVVVLNLNLYMFFKKVLACTYNMIIHLDIFVDKSFIHSILLTIWANSVVSHYNDLKVPMIWPRDLFSLSSNVFGAPRLLCSVYTGSSSSKSSYSLSQSLGICFPLPNITLLTLPSSWCPVQVQTLFAYTSCGAFLYTFHLSSFCDY